MDGVPVAEMRQLDIILTPHGFVKAALAPGANPTDGDVDAARRQPRHLRLDHGARKVSGSRATINDRNEIEFVQTHVANPMFGDMLYEMRYGTVQAVRQREVSVQSSITTRATTG